MKRASVPVAMPPSVLEPSQQLPRAVLADDHALLLDAFRLVLADIVQVVATARSGTELLQLVVQLQPDLAITDISMPNGSGLDATRAIRRLGLPTRVIVLTVHEDAALAETVMAAGAWGYVVKSASALELEAAVASVLHGVRWISPLVPDRERLLSGEASAPRLSDREREVARGIVAGEAAKQTAARLGITTRTVAFHRERLRERFHVRTTAELVRRLLAMDHLA